MCISIVRARVCWRQIPQEGPPDLGLTDAAAVGKEVTVGLWEAVGKHLLNEMEKNMKQLVSSANKTSADNAQTRSQISQRHLRSHGIWVMGSLHLPVLQCRALFGANALDTNCLEHSFSVSRQMQEPASVQKHDHFFLGLRSCFFPCLWTRRTYKTHLDACANWQWWKYKNRALDAENQCWGVLD